MAINIHLSNTRYAQIDAHPDQCPMCHTKVIAKLVYGHDRINSERGARIELVYECPNSKCNEIFIGYFCVNDSGTLRWYRSRPFEPIPVPHSQPIRDISPAFCEIYDQAHQADEFGLTQICGVGYRKAVEFLLKDYLVRKRPDDKVAIEATPLGTCIKSYVEDTRIKQVSERAIWLGNDETHYRRHWEDKDVTDLRGLIDLVLHWIEIEHRTEELLSSMPAGAKRR